VGIHTNWGAVTPVCPFKSRRKRWEYIPIGGQ